MNEQLQAAITALIEKASNGADAGFAFLTAEIPDVVYQLLLWHGVKSFVTSIIVLLLIPVWVYFDRKVYHVACKSDDDGDLWLGWGVWGCILRIPAFILACTYLSIDWLQILIAPKVWLIEYVASLAN